MKIDEIVEYLQAHFLKYRAPIVDLIEIQTRDPFKILVATVISARTKDEVTTQAVERLFKKVASFDDLDMLDEKEIAALIYPAGFYRAKAKHLKQLPEALRMAGGEVPQTLEGLLQLPGVGRKTANLVLALAFKIPAICVDTHMHRFFNRIGYVKTKNVLETELALRKKLPRKYWLTINSLVVAYGQHTCRPLNPYCAGCPFAAFCSDFKMPNIALGKENND